MRVNSERFRIVTRSRLVTIVGLSSGRITNRYRLHTDAPSTSAAASTSEGRLRKPAENTSIENATLRHRFARDTISIGTRTRKFVPVSHSRIDRVPPAWENAYQMRATVISGNTHATITIDPTMALIGRTALRSRIASSMPRTDWPTIAEPTTNRIVSHEDLMKT